MKDNKKAGNVSSVAVPRIVIIGAGFGGLWAARKLRYIKADILILDRNNYHTFQPLLYQVSAAELEPEDIVYPLRSIFRRFPNVHFLMDDVTGIDFGARLVKASDHVFPYDYLVLAVGSTPHFYGVSGAAEHSFHLKTLEEAVTIRNHILYCFERALCESDLYHRQQMLTFTIVGGGPTGVELAGALAELTRSPLVKDYPSLDFKDVQILLLEATDHLLPGFPPRLQAFALKRLRQMGVDVRLNQPVTDVTSQALFLKDGSLIPTETVIWTAGVRGEVPSHTGEISQERNGQINILPTLQIPDHPEVYIVGDLANARQDELPLPMVAPVAIQEGEMAAKNIIRQMRGQEPVAFHYHDPGMMVTMGRNAAVAQILGFSFTGFTAWLLWLSVNLYRLIGFRNRLIVMLNWAWDYLFFERVVRLILPTPDR